MKKGLIDRGALNFEKLIDTNNQVIPVLEYVSFLKGVEAAIKIIDEAPTVEAKKIVYCKKCKFYEKRSGVTVCSRFRRKFNMSIQETVVPDNGYCWIGVKN